MNLAGQIDKLVERRFSEERAETIVLMREAAILLFDAFPEMLVVVGGANLVLFQEGVRHSADLDFFPVAGELPEIIRFRCYDSGSLCFDLRQLQICQKH